MLLKYLAAVHVEPPVADEVLLVEDGAVGAEEGVLQQAPDPVIGADVEGLAVGLRVSVVALYLVAAGEGGVWRLAEHRVVVSGQPGDGLRQLLELVLEAVEARVAGRAGRTII